MPKIGQFIRNASGYSGQLRSLSLDTEIIIVGISHGGAENAPDFRIHLDSEDGPEIGAGWKRTGERVGEFIALVIDDPFFPRPIRAHLFRDDDDGHAWSLHWTRPPRRDARS